MTSETITGVIRHAAKQLALRGVETPALDARLLMQAAAELRHSDIIAEPDVVLAPDVVARFWVFIERRSAFEPVSRILGIREFYGREFCVTPAVLDPRADTETLIEAALSIVQGQSPLHILDLGTGSGAIAITLLAELPGASGVATDVSPDALVVAKANAESLGVSGRLQFFQAQWFDGLEGKFDLIVSNPPYIPECDIAGLAADVREFDPLPALAGGEDGLAAYKSIALGANGFLSPNGHILLEIGAGQEIAVQTLFEGAGFGLMGRYIDLVGHIRCLAFGKV